jgi:hypothetical protein
MEESKGASDSKCICVSYSSSYSQLVEDERLLAAARDDNEDLLLQVFDAADFDINFTDR